MKQKTTPLYKVLTVVCVLLSTVACHNAQKNQRVETLYATGKQWRLQNQLDSAINYFSQAEDAITSTTDPILQTKIHLNIGDLLAIQNNHIQTVEHYLKALKLYQELKDKKMEAYILSDIADCLWEKDNTISSARPYYDQALSISPDDTITGNIYQRIGTNYYHAHKYDSAGYYLHKSLQYPCHENNQSILLLFLGITSHKTHQTDSAKHYLQQALLHPAGVYQKSGCYSTLHEIARQEKDTPAIMYYAPLHAQYADSILKVESQLSKELHDIQTQKTEKLTAQKTRRNRWLAFFMGLTCVVTGACWLAVAAYRKRKAQAQQAEEQARLAEEQAQLAAEQVRQAKEQARLASTKTQELEKTLEQERLRREAFEQLKEDLMRKYETEEGRATERKRQTYEKLLAQVVQEAERHPLLSAKYKQCLLAACEKHLRWSDKERFPHLLNKEFNGFADKISQRFYKRCSNNQVGIRLCCLHWLNVPEQHILTIMNYSPGIYRQALDRTCDRFCVKTTDELIVALKELVMEDEEE